MSELKLNLGAGGNILPGFENHDADVDIRFRLPWADNTVDFILAEHVCEHIPTNEFFSFLKEAKRILKPGGTLRLCIPVLDNLRGAEKVDMITGHGHQAAYTRNLLYDIVILVFDENLTGTTGRSEIDGHWKVIGEDKDDNETCRIEATK